MTRLSLKNRFFLQNLLLFLIPLTIPLVILGGFSIMISENYLKDYINKSNRNLVAQTQQNLGLVVNSLTQIALLLDTDNGLSAFFDTYFNSENLAYSDVRTQNLIAGFLSSVALAKPEINSIYVYYPNSHGYFYVTHEGRMAIGEYRDRQWFTSYRSHVDAGGNWTELRRVPRFADLSNPVPVISLYRILQDGAGLVVLNLDPRALESIWQGLSVLPGQEILVLSREGQLLFGNTPKPTLDLPELQRLALGPDTSLSIKGNIISRLGDDSYGWIILSLTPESSLYNLPGYLSSLTILLLVLTFAAGFMLTTYLVRLNYAQVQTIGALIENAERGLPLPPLPERVATIYEQITYEILKAFVEQSYLKLQLSEKTTRTRLLELETHQNQMNPHFLFNTLKTIYWKAFALSGSPNEACAMIDNLSDILAYALGRPEEAVTLADEIRTAKSYLAIQEVRYAGLFRTSWDCPASLGRVAVPKLLLQPILENCIYHGIREKGRPCRIHVRIRAAGGRLRISVADNGVGMDAERLAILSGRLDNPEASSRHIGLANTHQRIRLACGEGWGLNIRSRAGQGTCVRIILPAGD